MLSKQQRKLKRMAALISILSKYGFKEVGVRITGKNIKSADIETETDSDNTSVYTRIRMVLEELGPTFVKLGQAFSNREDILPKEMIAELQSLQDKVEEADLDIHEILEDNFGEAYKKYFQSVDKKPLGSASIAQVYKAVLASGEEVVLKVKRPDINEVIEGDLLLMKDLIRILGTYFEFTDTLNLEEAINTFEKSLLNELSLVNERENIEKLAKNFKDNPNTYVPKVYPYLSNNEVLCMEFIKGAKITDKAFLEEHDINPIQLAEKGLQLYLTQILEHGFFHADPHAGNIMVMPDGRIVFIDLGAMGTIYPDDQELLEDLILNLITKNVSKLIAILKKMALRIEIKDERKLNADITEILKMVDATSLNDIKIEVMLDKFKVILYENKVIMPNYFTLLARGIVLIESVGRTLNPEMNITSSIEPYISHIFKKRLSPQYLLNKGINKIAEITDDVQNIPVELRSVLLQLSEGNLVVNTKDKDSAKLQSSLKSSFNNLIIAIILASNMIGTAILLASDTKPLLFDISIWGLLGILTSGIIAAFLFLKAMRR